jgi:hypothetical protein
MASEWPLRVPSDSSTSPFSIPGVAVSRILSICRSLVSSWSRLQSLFWPAEFGRKEMVVVGLCGVAAILGACGSIKLRRWRRTSGGPADAGASTVEVDVCSSRLSTSSGVLRTVHLLTLTVLSSVASEAFTASPYLYLPFSLLLNPHNVNPRCLCAKHFTPPPVPAILYPGLTSTDGFRRCGRHRCFSPSKTLGRDIRNDRQTHVSGSPGLLSIASQSFPATPEASARRFPAW